MKVLRFLRVTFLLGLLLVSVAALNVGTAHAASSNVSVLEIKGTINPVLVDYIERGITKAEEDNSQALIIQMDTPGGLDTTMRDIIQLMDSADVPVVVYVPSGARAASAGFFITIASDIAAMAPDSAIGAASPISMSSEGEQELSDTLKAKILNDAIAYARALAKTHGRNVEWAESAVRDASSISASEALDIGVIEIVSPSISDLISQLDGFTYTELDGSTVTLNTSGADVDSIEMSGLEKFLYAISDPNIAYILLSFAMLGITVEIFNPGLIFPGVTGAICGLLAFYSLGMLPVNYAGILLMVLAFALFIAEFFTPTFGVLTAGGLASLIAGSLILFKGGGIFTVDIWLVVLIAVLVTAFFVFAVSRIVKAHRTQATTGSEELKGKAAVVKKALNPNGSVFYDGEIWNAQISKGSAEEGEEVIIDKIDGLKLYVSKIKEEA